MQKTVVIDVVGLSPALIGEHTPRLKAFRDAGTMAPVESMLPAVTCSVQSTYLTGQKPSGHGIVGNGWYFRDDCEVHFWRQSNKLVQAEKIWDTARKENPAFTCANCFWWYNMYSTVDYSVTPRPMYPADGRKLPDIYTHPPELRDELQTALGQFPLFRFWGPATSRESTDWIARSTIEVDRKYDATLTLVYLPHLDYVLQKKGTSAELAAGDLKEVDEAVGMLLDHFSDSRIIILSEYGITPVDKPVHINRVLRDSGLLSIREEEGRDLLDCGASDAFAAVDHQVAHVYVRDTGRVQEVRELLLSTDGIAEVLDADGKREHGLDHSRSGELVAVAEPGAWFTYYYWDHDDRAPDFARTVDIHRKPGYDPVELFVDPDLCCPKLKIISKVLRKKLGFRTLMDVIPLDASLVKGSHGATGVAPENGPLIMTSHKAGLVADAAIPATAVYDVIRSHLFE